MVAFGILILPAGILFIVLLGLAFDWLNKEWDKWDEQRRERIGLERVRQRELREREETACQARGMIDLVKVRKKLDERDQLKTPVYRAVYSQLADVGTRKK